MRRKPCELERMSVEELCRLRRAVSSALRKARGNRARENGGRGIESELAAQQGARLRAALATNGRAQHPYRNPSNLFETWSGMGRRPRWVTAHLARGGTLEE